MNRPAASTGAAASSVPRTRGDEPLLPAAQEHILASDPEDGKPRFCRSVNDLSRAFALCPTHDEATRIRDDVAFFQAVRTAFLKRVDNGKSREDIDQAIRQLVSKAVSAGDEVIDVFSAAGLKRPDISILSDEFLSEVQHLPHRNLAVELLEKLLRGEIKTRRRRNVVQARSFAELLEQAISQYHKRAISTQEVIEHLIKLAKEMRDAQRRGESLGLNDDEIAFYDALAANESAVEVMGNTQLAVIAHELLERIRENISIDWTIKETVRESVSTRWPSAINAARTSSGAAYGSGGAGALGPKEAYLASSPAS